MSPEQILVAMSEVYATCASYRDAGRVATRFVTTDRQPRTSIQPFMTAFVRPGHFRFEYRERAGDAEGEWDRYIVWAGGGAVRTWWSVRPGVEEKESLDLALAGATGVSGGSAHTVPALLMPEVVSGRRLTELTQVVSLGDADLGGVACYRLRGRFAPQVDPAETERRDEEVVPLIGRRMERAEHSPTTMWIDRGTLLVRRIEEEVRFETFRSERVTEYEPQVGVVVADGELTFDPPEQSGASRDAVSQSN